MHSAASNLPSTPKEYVPASHTILIAVSGCVIQMGKVRGHLHWNCGTFVIATSTLLTQHVPAHQIQPNASTQTVSVCHLLNLNTIAGVHPRTDNTHKTQTTAAQQSSNLNTPTSKPIHLLMFESQSFEAAQTAGQHRCSISCLAL